MHYALSYLLTLTQLVPGMDAPSFSFFVGVAFLARELEVKCRKRTCLSSCDQPKTFKVEKSSGTELALAK